MAKPPSLWRHPVVTAAAALTLLAAVFAFALIGIGVARERPSGGDAAWVPGLLAAASAFLAAALLFRRLRGRRPR